MQGRLIKPSASDQMQRRLIKSMRLIKSGCSSLEGARARLWTVLAFGWCSLLDSAHFHMVPVLAFGTCSPWEDPHATQQLLRSRQCLMPAKILADRCCTV